MFKYNRHVYVIKECLCLNIIDNMSVLKAVKMCSNIIDEVKGAMFSNIIDDTSGLDYVLEYFVCLF